MMTTPITIAAVKTTMTNVIEGFGSEVEEVTVSPPARGLIHP